jgi:hypothetical protein
MEAYKTVGTYTTEFEAKLAESILNEAGIATFLQSPDVYPPLDYTRGIRLKVLPEDEVRAKEFLAQFDREQNNEDADRETPL